MRQFAQRLKIWTRVSDNFHMEEERERQSRDVRAACLSHRRSGVPERCCRSAYRLRALDLRTHGVHGRCRAIGLKVRVQSQWKAHKKGRVEENKACWSLAKYYLGSTSASPADTLYPGVTYTHLVQDCTRGNEDEAQNKVAEAECRSIGIVI
jgi:hypothetical protein